MKEKYELTGEEACEALVKYICGKKGLTGSYNHGVTVNCKGEEVLSVEVCLYRVDSDKSD